MIPFSRPAAFDAEMNYLAQVHNARTPWGGGEFYRKASDKLRILLKASDILLTQSCTSALELAALGLNIQPGDEVIMPSYTFVSTANAFVLRGAKIVFADSRKDHPGVDEDSIEALITNKTKAIVPVHYAGVACDMDKIMALAHKYSLFVVEDAAQAIDSFYIGIDGIKRPLGSIGHLAAFSFHETKNIISGEGGMLVINDEQFVNRAEIIREKGTNRSAFFRGEIDKYGWVDVGSSFLPSDIIAAFLYAQLENIDDIQKRRLELWHQYNDGLKELELQGKIRLPVIPSFATNNAHMFYVVCNNLEERSMLLEHLKHNNINAVFHYQSLHKSSYYENIHDSGHLSFTDFYTDTLLRLPLHYHLSVADIEQSAQVIHQFYSVV
jgi:dTDP-4-amino-4,6-dideoxygalactose transaminase